MRGCLHVKLNSSRDEIIPVYGEISLTPTVYTFLPTWDFIPGWTHPCQKDRDEILPWDEKKKKRRVNASSRDEVLKWLFFFNFWCMNSNIMGTAFFPLGGQRDRTRKKMYIFDYELLRHWRDWNWTRKQNHLILTQRLNHLAKLSGRLAILRVQVFEYSFRWFWVRVQLQSLHLQISRLLRARSSLTFKQL